MFVEFIVRHLGPGGCGRPAFWVTDRVDETLLLYGVQTLDGSEPPVGAAVSCGSCGRRVHSTHQMPLWVEPAVRDQLIPARS